MVGLTACLVLLAGGCGDDDPDKADPPSPSPSSSDGSGSPAEPTTPTETATTVAPATGPVLKLRGTRLRLPEGWHVDNDQSNILVVGASEDLGMLINLSSFPSLDRKASLEDLAKATVETGGYAKGSIKKPGEMAGRPAFRVAGKAYGDYTEEYGLIHKGDIVSVEFVFIDAPKQGRRELIESVLATVRLP